MGGIVPRRGPGRAGFATGRGCSRAAAGASQRSPRPGSAARPSSSASSRRWIAWFARSAPAEQIGSGGNGFGSRSTIGSVVTSSVRRERARARIRPPEVARPDAVARVAEPVVHGPAGRACRRTAGGAETSIGPPQAASIGTSRNVGNPRAGPRPATRTRRSSYANRGSMCRAEVRLHPAAAERDPPVRRRPQVVQRRAEVVHALAVGPADLGEALGRGLGDHHVRAAHHDRAPERASSAAPTRSARRPPRPARTVPCGVSRDHGGAAPEPRDRRVLVDAHAAREQRVPQPPREARRLHAGTARREHAAAEQRRVAPRPHLLEGERAWTLGHAEALGGLSHQCRPTRLLRGRGRDADVAVALVPGVDAVGLAPRADRADALVRRRAMRRPRSRPRRSISRPSASVAPERVHEPAVAPARPAAADVLLEQHDVDAGLALASGTTRSTSPCSRRRGSRRRRSCRGRAAAPAGRRTRAARGPPRATTSGSPFEVRSFASSLDLSCGPRRKPSRRGSLATNPVSGSTRLRASSRSSFRRIAAFATIMPGERIGSGGKRFGSRRHDRQAREPVVGVERERREDLAAQMTRADPVARVAEAVVHVAAAHRAEERHREARDVDRPAPAGLDAARRRTRGTSGRGRRRRAPEPLVVVVPGVDPAREVRLQPAEPERDPPVRRRAHVVDRGAEVAHRFAAGPVICSSFSGRRRGHHHVRAADREDRLERLPPGGPRAERRSRPRPHERSRRAFRRPRAPDAEPRDRRALVDPHAALEEHAAQTARQARRLHVRRVAR